LQRFIVLFFIELSTRKVEIAGIARTANGLWMSQIARNLTDAGEEILTRKRYLIHDRDPLFTAEFLQTDDSRCCREISETADAIPKLECLSRAVRPQDQRIVPRPG